jgi:alkylhydroperoxidase/carboxymuconolactone decarboxylase family protein YurZ
MNATDWPDPEAPEAEAPDPRREALRTAFIAERGFWAPPFEAMLAADPDFFAAYLEFSSVPARHGALEPKVREFMYIAVDAATTHLHADGTRAHIRAALRHGATSAEIMEVLELTSLLGLQTCTLAVPILLAELAAAGAAPPAALSPEQADIKRRVTERRGGWEPGWDAILAADPDFFAACAQFAAVPWTSGVLPPMIKELVCLAADAATTHLHAEGTRAHIRAALRHGAAPAQVMEVLEVTSVLGIHTCTLAVPILLDELRPT